MLVHLNFVLVGLLCPRISLVEFLVILRIKTKQWLVLSFLSRVIYHHIFDILQPQNGLALFFEAVKFLKFAVRLAFWLIHLPLLALSKSDSSEVAYDVVVRAEVRNRVLTDVLNTGKLTPPVFTRLYIGARSWILSRISSSKMIWSQL